MKNRITTLLGINLLLAVVPDRKVEILCALLLFFLLLEQFYNEKNK